MRTAGKPTDRERQQRHRRDFVKLGGVAANAIAEIDAPGQCSGGAVGKIGEAGEKASNASDGDSSRDGQCEKIAGAGGDFQSALGPLDGRRAAEQAADNGFAGHQVQRMVQLCQRRSRIFQPGQQLAAQCGPDGGGHDNRESIRIADHVAAAAFAEINAKGDAIRQPFEKRVGIQRILP